MHIYISGYYGYKNFGDELLLLGMLNYITKVSINNISKITIECKDPNFLTNLLQEYISSNLYKTGENSGQKLEILPVNKVKTDVDSLSIRYKKGQGNNLGNTFRTVYIQCRQRVRNAGRSGRVKNTYDYVYIGGGEALTSARKFPHNGWSAYIRFLPYFFNKKVILLGGFGRPDGFIQKYILYPLYLSGSSKIVCREDTSYTVVKDVVGLNANNKVVLYQDFSLSVLLSYVSQQKHKIIHKKTKKYGILNINAHIRSSRSIEKIGAYIQKHKNIGTRYFFPASSGSDDSDLAYGKKLLKLYPDLDIIIRDWPHEPFLNSLDLLAGAQTGIVARLHLVIPLHLFDVTYEPLVYQEKITHMIDFLKKRDVVQ